MVARLRDAGVLTIAAAGNEDSDACGQPFAAVPEVLSVGNSTKKEKRNRSSNFGACIDLFAPGTNIQSTSVDNNQDFTTLSGTSQAAPHVTGAVSYTHLTLPTKRIV